MQRKIGRSRAKFFVTWPRFLFPSIGFSMLATRQNWYFYEIIKSGQHHFHVEYILASLGPQTKTPIHIIRNRRDWNSASETNKFDTIYYFQWCHRFRMAWDIRLAIRANINQNIIMNTILVHSSRVHWIQQLVHYMLASICTPKRCSTVVSECSKIKRWVLFHFSLFWVPPFGFDFLLLFADVVSIGEFNLLPLFVYAKWMYNLQVDCNLQWSQFTMNASNKF